MAAELVHVYLRASKGRIRVFTGLNACFDGLWLGLLDGNSLAALDQRFYEGRREVLDGRTQAYADDAYNLQGLQSWEAACIEEHFPPAAHVVVTGAGTGREVFALLERGFEAVGYEPHPGLLSAGNEFLSRHGYENRLLAIERSAFPQSVPQCDGVLVGWGSYTLIPGRERRIAFLRAARAALTQEAPLLMSFFVRGAHGRYFSLVTALANAIRAARRKEPVERGDTLNPVYAHYFTREELDAEVTAAGFRMVSFETEPYGHAVLRAA